MKIYQLVTDYDWDGEVTECISPDLEQIKKAWEKARFISLNRIYVWENGERDPVELNPYREFKEPEEEK